MKLQSLNNATKLAASVIGIAFAAALPATPALAMNQVPCDDNRQDFLWVELHGDQSSDTYHDGWNCFANSGDWFITPGGLGVNVWVTRIRTGNNRVQWEGDGRWQPDQPIDRWTDFSWPHYPGGVRINSIRIVD